MLSRSSRFLLILGDMIALMSALFLSSYASSALTHHEYFNIQGFFQSQRFVTYTAMSIFLIFTFYNRGHYSRRIPWWNQLRFIVLSCVITMIVDGFINYSLKSQFSRLWLALSWIYAGIAILLLRHIVRLVLDSVFNVWSSDVYIIGRGESVTDAVYAFTHEKYAGYNVKAILSFGDEVKFSASDLPRDQQIEVITQSEKCSELLKSDAIFIIVDEDMEHDETARITHYLSQNNAFFFLAPSTRFVSAFVNKPQQFFGHNLMLFPSNNGGYSPLFRMFKRFCDVVSAMVGLAILLLVLPFLYLGIKKDGGTLFFPNKRIGQDGKEFSCWKLRTMAVDAEQRLAAVLADNPEMAKDWETHRKMERDPRVTSIGRLLRKTSLDELPQFWNVLKGEMALVGPRPILEDEKIFFNDKQYELYASAKPGITGLWQVTGRNNTSFKRRVELDCWYILNANIWHDVVIICKTIFAVVIK